MITLPEKLESIEKEVFFGCEKLKDVFFLGNIKVIGDGAFSYCSSIESLSLPDSITSIGRDAFAGCNKLSEIELPPLLSSVEACLFFGCSELKNIHIPQKVKSIGASAFAKCNKIKTLTFTNSVVDIHPAALIDMEALEEIVLTNNSPIGRIVDGVLFSKDMKRLLFCLATKKGQYTIPEQVETIGEFSFKGSSLETIILPNDLRKIDANAFSDISNLCSIFIPNSVKWIGEYNFTNCNNVIIRANKNSYAIEYAKEHQIKYEEI